MQPRPEETDDEDEGHIRQDSEDPYARLGLGLRRPGFAGRLPIMPLYGCWEREVAELRAYLMDSNLVSTIGQQMQQCTAPMYRLNVPEVLSDVWMEHHVHKVYLDQYELLLGLRQGCDSPTDALRQLLSFQRAQADVVREEDDFIGYEIRLPVVKLSPGAYQDGSDVRGEEVELSHATREGLLHSILRRGLWGSIPSHKTEGCWTFGVRTMGSFEWGRSDFETFHGCVLQLRAPAELWD